METNEAEILNNKIKKIIFLLLNNISTISVRVEFIG